MIKITILGGGSWGTAIAQQLAQNGYSPVIYLRDQKLKDYINQNHINQKYFPGIKLLPKIRATLNLEEAVSSASILFLTVPTQATRGLMKKIMSFLKPQQLLISTAKGVESNSYLRNSEIIRKFTDLPLVVLSGPSHAEEVINNLPTAIVVAARSKVYANKVQDLLMSASFRVYTNPDLIGVEIGGAIKNIIALAAGITDGIGYGDNTRAALITRGLHEMSRLGAFLGAKHQTFAGLAGLGDLVVTCNSMFSRNRLCGILIGKGYQLNDALAEINQVVEGVLTTEAIYKWAVSNKFSDRLPITNQIYQVLFQNKSPVKAVNDLMLRGPKHENEEVVNQIEW